MKRVVLMMATAFALSACGGGGGGGAAPSVNLDDSRDDSQIEQPILTETEQTQARSLANDLRSEIVDSGIGTEQDSLLRKIDSLVNDIDAARKTINDLLAEMTELRSQLKDALKVAETQTEPPPPNCGANEKISGQNCVCVDGYQRNNSGMCEMIPPNCGANEIADGQNCVCISGYVRQNGVCELPPPNCGTNEIADGQNCVCISGYVRQNGACESESPSLNCGANEKPTFGLGTSPYCICVDGYVRQNGVCELPPPSCGAYETAHGQICNCIPGYTRQNGICELNCGANEEANGRLCKCVSGYKRIKGICEPPPPPVSLFDTEEYRASKTLRHTNPIPAYEAGAFGQGVTVLVVEAGGYLPTHEDLAANVITTTTTLAKQDNIYPSERKWQWHGTAVAGILGAVRGNGKGAHGIAPSVKMWLTGNGGDDSQHFYFATLHGIPIISRSYAFYPDETDTFETLQNDSINIRIASLYAAAIGDADIVNVRGIGNHYYTNTLTLPVDSAVYPILQPGIEDNMLFVVNIKANNEIDQTSRYCEFAKRYCLAAYGGGDIAPGAYSDTDYVLDFRQTSASTPVVSGALALLKSAADMLVPQMSAMTTVRLILLETATPLYADASKNGVRIMENGEPVLSSVYGWGLVNISAGITHLQGIANQMSSIKQMQVARLGGAAKLANGNKFAPANGKNAFRFWGGIETENAWTGIATQEYGGVSGFAEYGKANMRINSFLTNGEIRNAESQSWTAGIQFGDLIRHNDNLRFSAREESRISDGELILQYSFGKQIRIPIKQKPQTIYTAGYSQKTENSKWSAAAEWNAATNAKGVSFAVELQIR